MGDRVTVANHGNHWIQVAKICSIDKRTKLAVVELDVTMKKDTVDLGDCKKYGEMDFSQKKHEFTDFFLDIPDKKWNVNKKSDALLNPPTG